MRILLCIFYITGVLFGGVPSSSVTISGLTTAQQTQRPITLHRVFAEGGIWNFAKPSIRGVGIPDVWQNDVKTRWRDGRTTVAVTGVSNTSPVHITAPGHGFQEGEIVTVSGVTGNTGANKTGTVYNVSADGFDLLNTPGNGVYAGGGIVSGPAAGTLKDVLISFRADVPASPGRIIVDFVDDTNQCSSGDSAACAAAGLDGPGMLDFNGGTWSATTQVNASGNIYSAAARNLIGTGKFTYWQRGPAATVVVAEDASVTRAYDFGYACTADCTGDYSTAIWTADPINRSLHPIFVLSFFSNWPGVKVEYIMENVWTSALKDQRYDITLQNSFGTIYTAPGVTHYVRTRWRKQFWDGSEPGGAGNERAGIKVDYNLPYMVYSRIIMPYDLTANPSGSVNTIINAFNTNQTAGREGLECPKNDLCGNIYLRMGSTGGRGDIGPLTQWDVTYLYTFDPGLRRVIEGNADLVGLIPLHYRESVPTFPPYDLAETVPSLGMPVSVDARRTISLGYQTHGSILPVDRLTYLMPASTAVKWGLDTAHFPSTTLVAYLTTGDWWYWSNQRDVSALMIGFNTGAGSGPRMKRIGYPDFSQTRGAAWSLREYLIGATIAPDNTPEKNYFMQKFNNWIAFEDGVLNNTVSRFYQPGAAVFNYKTEEFPWPLGRGMLRGLVNSTGWPNPLGMSPQFGECSDFSQLDQTVVPSAFYCGKPFMWYFLHTVVAWAHQLGSPVEAIRTAIAPFVVEQLLDPSGCRFCASNYNIPARPADAPAAVLTAAVTSNQLNLPVDQIPPGWDNPPYVLRINNERVKICSVDILSKILAACPGTGRSMWEGPSVSHPAGTVVNSLAYYQSWSDVKRGVKPIPTAFDFTGGGDSYGGYARAVAAGYTDIVVRGYSGQDAYDYIYSQSLASSLATAAVNANPKFSMRPRRDPVRVLEIVASDTTAVLQYLKPRPDKPCTVDGVPDNTTDSRIVSYTWTGLAANTDYSTTIHCDDDPYTGGDTIVQFRTAVLLEGDGQITLTLGPSAGSVFIDYGRTQALGSTVSASCTSGCTVPVALPKGVGYYRVRRTSGVAGTTRRVLVK